MPVACSVLGVLPLFLVGAQSVGLQRALAFGPAKLGLITSAFFAASAAAAWPLGHVIERIGSRRALIAALAALATALALVAAGASRWWHLALALAVCGAANAVVQIASNTALAAGVARRRQGLAFGAKQAAIPLASLTAGATLPLVLLVAGWRVAFAGAAVVTAAVLAAIACPSRAGGGATRGPSPPVRGAPVAAAGAPSPPPGAASTAGAAVADLAPGAPGAPGAGLRPAGARRVLARLGAAGLLAGAVASSIPAFAVDAAVTHGFDEDAAATLLAVGSAVAFATRLGAGWLVDRRGSAAIGELTAFVAAGALAFALLAAVGTAAAAFVVGYLLAFATAWGWPGLLHYAAVCVRRDAPAVASGAVLSVVFLGNIIGPATVGFVVEHASYAAAWAMCAAVLALAAAAAGAAAPARSRRRPVT